jgi:oligoendopeptidase F
MNSTENLRDLVTMVHEGGHAIHSFLTKDIELLNYKELASEVAELASMSMELISMEHWDFFFDDKEELKRAKKTHLEDVLTVLPWVATVDKFQHWLYVNPTHSVKEREEAWNNIFNEFGSKTIDWSSFEKAKTYTWQKQLHIYEVPFYYIEYAISQLGAIAIWKNFKQNPEKALDQYEEALKLGYSKPIPEIYKTAGIKFDFSEEYVKELMQFVSDELKQLQ